jgi:hypothetical protein
MSGDGNQASMVATMLQTGDGFALCDECIIPWAAGLLGVMTGVDMEPYLLAVSADGVTDDQVAAAEHAVDQGAPEASPTPAKRTVRRGLGPNGSHAAGTETAPVDGTTPTETDVTSPAA